MYANAQHRAVYQIFRLTLSTAPAGGDCKLTNVEIMNGTDSRVQPLLLPIPMTTAARSDPMFFGGKATAFLYFMESSLAHPLELKRAVVCAADPKGAEPLFSKFAPVLVPTPGAERPVRRA